VPSGCFNQRERPHDVGVEERAGIVERIVVVRFRSEMHNDVCLSNQSVDQVAVTDVPVNEHRAVTEDGFDRGLVAGVRQRVKHCDVVIRVIDDVVNEVGADETRTTRDEHPIHLLSLIDAKVRGV